MTSTDTSMATLDVLCPVDGWIVPLVEVPDPVFSGGLAGDGVAIDPVGELLHAPCDGMVRLMRGGRHALMMSTAAGDLLLHVGIDTVALRGEGFDLCVTDGARVQAGQPLLRFDLDLLAARAPSLVTPVLLSGAAAGAILQRRGPGRVRVGEVLYTARSIVAATTAAAPVPAISLQREWRVPFDHGLHARPAAQIAAALGPFLAQVRIVANGRSASARSPIGMMTLGVDRGDRVEIHASGADAAAALEALAGIFGEAALLRPGNVSAAVRAARPSAGSSVAAVIASRGVSIGVAFSLRDVELEIPPSCGDIVAERARLAAAIATVRRQLLARAERMDGVRRGVLDAHLALLEDPELMHEAQGAVASGHGAGAAWRDTLARAADALGRLGDPRMAERRADLIDLQRQVLRAIAGVETPAGSLLPERAIVLADELLPSQLLALDAGRVAGLCTALGGATSHVAILAASLGLPMLVAAGAAVLEIADGTTLVLDADVGFLHVAPGAEELAAIQRRVTEAALWAVADAASAGLSASLRDGTSVRVDANLGAVEEAVGALRGGADGCGLLRTEFLFLERDTAPTEDEQLAVYQALADALGGRPLTIRTLDAGGDKPIPFLPMPPEENPALGLRGVRTSLAMPAVFDAQLRALLRVRSQHGCRILLPMVTDAADVRLVRERLVRLAAELGVAMPSLGAMIETPASALLADQLAPLVDFFSIGSNDLSQYVLAIDRLHPTLASRLDALHPAVLRMIATATAAASAGGVEICVCGSLASDPEAVPLLLALGARELSVVPSMVGRIKSVVRTLSLADCAALLQQALALDSAEAVRAKVRDFTNSRATASAAE